MPLFDLPCLPSPLKFIEVECESFSISRRVQRLNLNTLEKSIHVLGPSAPIQAVLTLITEASTGHSRGLEAAELVAAILILSGGPVSTSDDSSLFNPVLTSLFLSNLIQALARSASLAESEALVHLTVCCLIFCGAIRSGDLPMQQLRISPMDGTESTGPNPARCFLEVSMQLMDRPSQLVSPAVFSLLLLSHPAVRHCILNPQRVVALALCRFGRYDLLLSVFDLKRPQDRRACADLLAFGDRPEEDDHRRRTIVLDTLDKQCN